MHRSRDLGNGGRALLNVLLWTGDYLWDIYVCHNCGRCLRLSNRLGNKLTRWRTRLESTTAAHDLPQFVLRELLEHLSLFLNELLVLVQRCSVYGSDTWRSLRLWVVGFVQVFRRRIPSCQVLVPLPGNDRLVWCLTLTSGLVLRCGRGLSLFDLCISLSEKVRINFCLCGLAEEVLGRGGLRAAVWISCHCQHRGLSHPSTREGLSVVFAPQIVAWPLLLHRGLLLMAVGCGIVLLSLVAFRRRVGGISRWWISNLRRTGLLSSILLILKGLARGMFVGKRGGAGANFLRGIGSLLTHWLGVFICGLLRGYHDVAQLKGHGRVEAWWVVEVLMLISRRWRIVIIIFLMWSQLGGRWHDLWVASGVRDGLFRSVQDSHVRAQRWSCNLLLLLSGVVVPKEVSLRVLLLLLV